MKVALPKPKDCEKYHVHADWFKEIITVGYGKEARTCIVDTHTARNGEVVPVVEGTCEGSNVTVRALTNNSLFNFFSISLFNPIIATLLYPISSNFKGDALGQSEMEAVKNREPLHYFERKYHNKTLVQGFRAIAPPVEIAQTIRYLDAVSRLDGKKLLEIVTDKKGRGAIGRSGPREIRDLEELLGIERPNGEKAEWPGNLDRFEMANAPDFYEKLQISWSDGKINGGAKIHVKLQREGIPRLMLPYGTVSIPTTDEQKDAGLNGEIPLSCLKYTGERKSHSTKTFILNTPNKLDNAMTVLYLTKAVAPVAEALKGKVTEYQHHLI